MARLDGRRSSNSAAFPLRPGNVPKSESHLFRKLESNRIGEESHLRSGGCVVLFRRVSATNRAARGGRGAEGGREIFCSGWERLEKDAM